MTGAYAVFPDLAGRACLVTGASSGIGAAVAAGFGAQRAKVLVHYHRDRSGAEQTADAIRCNGGEAVIHGADLAARTGADLVAAAVAAFGRLDVVVNNAGGFDRRAPLAETDEAEVDAVLGLNLRSVVSVSRASLQHLEAVGGGAIVNTLSLGARTGGATGAVLYNTAKGALATFTRGLAREVVQLGIRVNAVAPGIIKTPLQHRTTTPAMLKDSIAGVPLGRAGTPEDCVHAYLFLASSLAAAYVTGQVIEVNGGLLMP